MEVDWNVKEDEICKNFNFYNSVIKFDGVKISLEGRHFPEFKKFIDKNKRN